MKITQDIEVTLKQVITIGDTVVQSDKPNGDRYLVTNIFRKGAYMGLTDDAYYCVGDNRRVYICHEKDIIKIIR